MLDSSSTPPPAPPPTPGPQHLTLCFRTRPNRSHRPGLGGGRTTWGRWAVLRWLLSKGPPRAICTGLTSCPRPPYLRTQAPPPTWLLQEEPSSSFSCPSSPLLGGQGCFPGASSTRGPAKAGECCQQEQGRPGAHHGLPRSLCWWGQCEGALRPCRRMAWVRGPAPHARLCPRTQPLLWRGVSQQRRHSAGRAKCPGPPRPSHDSRRGNKGLLQ